MKNAAAGRMIYVPETQIVWGHQQLIDYMEIQGAPWISNRKLTRPQQAVRAMETALQDKDVFGELDLNGPSKNPAYKEGGTEPEYIENKVCRLRHYFLGYDAAERYPGLNLMTNVIPKSMRQVTGMRASDVSARGRMPYPFMITNHGEGDNVVACSFAPTFGIAKAMYKTWRTLIGYAFAETNEVRSLRRHDKSPLGRMGSQGLYSAKRRAKDAYEDAINELAIDLSQLPSNFSRELKGYTRVINKDEPLSELFFRVPDLEMSAAIASLSDVRI